MMRIPALRSVARQCVAAIAMFGFSLNVATPTIMHGCAHAAALAPTGVHSGHHQQQSDQAPTDQSSHGKECQCVGQSCGTALAVPSPLAAGPRIVPVSTHSEPVRHADRLPAVDQHLLPFAVGPPSSILA